VGKLALALTGIGLFVAAVVVDWRAVGLVLAAWWIDNILKTLRERNRGA
jgi:hypothetical protein